MILTDNIINSCPTGKIPMDIVAVENMIENSKNNEPNTINAVCIDLIVDVMVYPPWVKQALRKGYFTYTLYVKHPLQIPFFELS